jgi:hypothetical protein
MDQNEPADRTKSNSSQTTIKAFGVEFSGPSWVAIVVVVVAVIGAAIYFSNPGSDDDLTAAEDSASSDAPGEQPAAAVDAEDKK